MTLDDEGMALLQRATTDLKHFCVSDGLVRELEAYLAKPRQQSAEPVAYRERITGRLAAPEDEHRQRFPMCYEPLYVRCTANLHTQ